MGMSKWKPFTPINYMAITIIRYSVQPYYDVQLLCHCLPFTTTTSIKYHHYQYIPPWTTNNCQLSTNKQARGILLVCSFFLFLSYFTNDYLLIGTTYHPLPLPTTPHERATKQMKMAQTMVYCRLGHRYPFFSHFLFFY